MERIEQVCGLLQKKRDFFLRYEEATYSIAAGDAEQIEEYMQERLELQQEIDAITQELGGLCKEEADGGQLRLAIAAGCARGELPVELQTVFDRSMALRAVMARIQEIEPQALERVTQERDELLERIKSVNMGTGAAAAKYYRSTSPRAAEERQRTVKKV